jgi:putative ABC transport system permease protein
VGTPFHFLAGGPFQGPDDMLVDDYFAAQQHVHVGQKLELLNHQFRVSGVVEHGKGARKFIPIQTLQDLIGAQGKASIFYVSLDSPANAEAVVAAIKQIPGMERYSVRSMREYLSLMTPGNLPGFSTFINVVIGVSVVIGFIVIFQSMYTAVMERTREIGILKSLGATKFYIVNVVLRESLVLAIGGVLMGLVFTWLGTQAIDYAFPIHKLVWDNHWVLRAAVIAISGAVLGGLYPALVAAQKDPIEALAYE